MQRKDTTTSSSSSSSSSSGATHAGIGVPKVIPLVVVVVRHNVQQSEPALQMAMSNRGVRVVV
jgi:hypothetical protein